MALIAAGLMVAVVYFVSKFFVDVAAGDQATFWRRHDPQGGPVQSYWIERYIGDPATSMRLTVQVSSTTPPKAEVSYSISSVESAKIVLGTGIFAERRDLKCIRKERNGNDLLLCDVQDVTRLLSNESIDRFEITFKTANRRDTGEFSASVLRSIVQEARAKRPDLRVR